MQTCAKFVEQFNQISRIKRGLVRNNNTNNNNNNNNNNNDNDNNNNNNNNNTKLL